MSTKRKSPLPLLGGRITIRNKGGPDRLIYTVGILLPILVGLAILLSGPLPPWPILAVAAPIMVAASWFFAEPIFQIVEFYEHAVVQRMFSRVRVFKYSDVKSLDFGVERHFVNGSHVGTIFKMRLEMADGRRLRLQAPYGGADDRIEIARGAIANHPRASSDRAALAAQPEGEVSLPRKRYYVWFGCQEQRPYSIKQLRAALRKNDFDRSTPVRRDDEVDMEELQKLLLRHPHEKSISS
jgi:hypothetical protein